MAPRVLVVQRPVDVDRLAFDVEQEVAPDGEAALALLASQSFDALVVDLSLPLLDGWCLLAAAGRRPDTPPVLLVGPTAARDAERARRLGATWEPFAPRGR